ncbi:MULTISPECIES: FAD-dependent monooxygenase [Arthrobacter]|uniref:FAD-dependent monooxygenase n=2 Tax=Arthrobacter TaxID=1663 RepID=A0ABU9KKJ2_9MICC|nr:FAD-dependent monooxygenase [Arthrobacter sp. YJM1]MDP5227362.1 FAD-dependent monooxygenase [Arthrobacter sp. YJM1]
MNTFDADVVMVGGGPSGLAAACALAPHGRSAVIVDEALDHTLASRAPTVHAGTLGVLARIGCAEELIAEGTRAGTFRMRNRTTVLTTQPMHSLPGPYRFAVIIPQHRTEAILRARAETLGVRFVKGRASGVVQDGTGVRILLDGGGVVTGRFLVAADGMRSTIRQAVGIPYPETAASRGDREPMLIADVRPGQVPEEPVIVMSSGALVLLPLPGGILRIIMNAAPEAGVSDLEILRREFLARRPKGMDFEVGEVVWLSRFNVTHRLADTFRSGRVLLAGDAGHVHSPAGGQGMNLGIRDGVYAAEALDRSLRAEERGEPWEAPLDAYAQDRREAAAAVIGLTNRMMSMLMAPPVARPLRDLMLWTLSHTAAPRKQALALSGLLDTGPVFVDAPAGAMTNS